MTQYIAILWEDPLFPKDVTNVLFLYYDRYSIYDLVMYNQQTIRVVAEVLQIVLENKLLYFQV